MPHFESLFYGVGYHISVYMAEDKAGSIPLLRDAGRHKTPLQKNKQGDDRSSPHESYLYSISQNDSLNPN